MFPRLPSPCQSRRASVASCSEAVQSLAAAAQRVLIIMQRDACKAYGGGCMHELFVVGCRADREGFTGGEIPLLASAPHSDLPPTIMACTAPRDATGTTVHCPAILPKDGCPSHRLDYGTSRPSCPTGPCRSMWITYPSGPCRSMRIADTLPASTLMHCSRQLC